MKLKHSFLAILLLLSTISYSQDLNTRKKHFNVANGLAIQGYDPVAYFTTKKAVRGKKEIAFSHAGITYYFSSQSNKELFERNPSAYEPEYGGWCAYAMGANGEKVNVDPETFKIINNKLYLFYNKFFNNTLKDWNKDEISLKAKADQSWKATIQ